jgi:hypothetical protein
MVDVLAAHGASVRSRQSGAAKGLVQRGDRVPHETHAGSVGPTDNPVIKVTWKSFLIEKTRYLNVGAASEAIAALLRAFQTRSSE